MAELVSGVYADALFRAALDLDALAEIRECYDVFDQVARENPLLLDVLASPTVERGEKNEILDRMSFGKPFRNFLHVLLDKRRIAWVAEIKHEFDKLVRQHLGIETAYVTSVRPLTPAQLDQLRLRLGESTGLTVEIVCDVDESLIGGLRIRIGDTVMDGSVRHKLQKMLDRMTNAVVSSK